MDEEILKTLLKKATGYCRDEVQEEYSVGEDGEAVLVRRKVTKKYYPPDSAALKTSLELSKGEGDTARMSDEELAAEKKRLIGELALAERKNPKGGASAPRRKTNTKPKGEQDVEK